MQELTIFENTRFGKLRTVLENGEPWFVAADVCKALGLGNNRQAIARLDNDEKGVILSDTPGGKQSMTTVSESGLYSLVLGSRKPEAHLFKRWVTHDVLPSIRKTGAYVTPSLAQQIIQDPDTLFLILEQLRQERSARLSAEKNVADTQTQLSKALRKLDDIRPVPAFVFSGDPDANLCISVDQLAVQLSRHGHRFSRSSMFAWLRSYGYIRHDSPLPTSSAIQSGRMTIIEKRSGRSRYYTSAVTLAGQLYFESIFI